MPVIEFSLFVCVRHAHDPLCAWITPLVRGALLCAAHEHVSLCAVPKINPCSTFWINPECILRSNTKNVYNLCLGISGCNSNPIAHFLHRKVCDGVFSAEVFVYEVVIFPFIHGKAATSINWNNFWTIKKFAKMRHPLREIPPKKSKNRLGFALGLMLASLRPKVWFFWSLSAFTKKRRDRFCLFFHTMCGRVRPICGVSGAPQLGPSFEI